MDSEKEKKRLAKLRRLERDHQWDKARRLMRKVVKAAPDNPHHAIHYARLLTKCGDWKQARKFVRKAVKADPDLGEEAWVRRFSIAVERIANPDKKRLALLSTQAGRKIEAEEIKARIIQKGVNNSGGLIAWRIENEPGKNPQAGFIEKIFLETRHRKSPTPRSREVLFACHARLAKGAETLRLPRFLASDGDESWTSLMWEDLSLDGAFQKSYAKLPGIEGVGARIGKAAAEFNALVAMDDLDNKARRKLNRQPDWSLPSRERARLWMRQLMAASGSDAMAARLLDAVTPLLNWLSREENRATPQPREVVVHGDLVPNNLFLTPDAKIIPIDFEFVRFGPIGLDPARLAANAMVKIIEKHNDRRSDRWDRTRGMLNELVDAYVQRFTALRPELIEADALRERIDFLFRLRTTHELCRRGGSRVFQRPHQAPMLPYLLGRGFLLESPKP